MRTLRVLARVATACFSLVPLAQPQDSHYWTNQYGTRATLLGGAVIGSVLDLSGTYYNPGGLSLIKDPQTLIAAKVFQYPRVSIGGAGADSVVMKSSNPGPGPSLIAGTFKFRGLRKHWFGYSYLSRQEVKLGLSLSTTGVHDVIPGQVGMEDYVSQYRLDEKLSETWLGLTWSYKLRRNTGVGVSQYFAVRNHRANTQTLVEALDASGRVATNLGARQYQYENVRILWKIGAAFDFERLTLGLTLTTPGLHIYGKGSAGANAHLAGLDLDGDGAPDDFLAADYQDERPVRYRSPLSVAAGLTFKLQRFRVYASSEWFARVPPYTVVDTEEFDGQSTGEPLSTDVTNEFDSVLNMGFGLEYAHSARFKSSMSFTTDYSARPPGTETNLSITDWSIYHVIAGAEITIKNSALTLGLGYSAGDREIGRRPQVFDGSGGDGLWDPFEGMEFRYSTYKLIIGFSF
jgi:hypothetical protein